ncbi:LysR family transcriptional regulator [Aestuariibacter sp. AA17]|uniref:LysR family transcriptional regulator n=1 Tax=Fluctibacter corallii TaxID=2984329 RepID=A0ABT3AAN3_9ALTE|nr:LysR family transcriptional regulator [Aestuariibacter sp. AA17]MCV2885669.1 LysR family transcriptional regulator [Aestuariibacter sp. AA17]
MHHAVTLDALRVLEAIDQKGSFAAAAEALFKVPSALTYTVQKLESDLGVALFDRSKQRAKLTNAGQLLLQEGQFILASAARLEAKVRQIESGWETSLVIARDTIIPELPLLRVLSEFCQLDKLVEITIIEEALAGGWDALHSQRADIAIGVSGELPKGQYDMVPIGQANMVFAVASSHPLASVEGDIQPEHIALYPSIVVADSSRRLPTRSAGVLQSKQKIRVDNMLSKLQAQKEGLGAGFLPLHLVKPYLDSGEMVSRHVQVPRPAVELYLAKEKHREGHALNWFFKALSEVDWCV